MKKFLISLLLFIGLILPAVEVNSINSRNVILGIATAPFILGSLYYINEASSLEGSQDPVQTEARNNAVINAFKFIISIPVSVVTTSFTLKYLNRGYPYSF